jgi:hypothetical protein
MRGARAIERPIEWPPPLEKPAAATRIAAVVANNVTANNAAAPVATSVIVFMDVALQVGG